MSDLKADLASLRLEDEPKKSRKGLWIALAVVLLAAGAGLLAWRSSGGFARVEVATVTPTSSGRQRRRPGTPMLTASGYLVARREAVVSSKIQGRLSELRVEEGSEVQTGDILARARKRRLRGAGRARAGAAASRPKPRSVSADAAIQRAEADLAEAQRQLGVNERLNNDKLVPDRHARRREEPRATRRSRAGAVAGRPRSRGRRVAGRSRRPTSLTPKRSCRTRSSARRLPAPS